jgi:hypothetical protein
MKFHPYIILFTAIIIACLALYAFDKAERSNEKLQKILDSKELREFSFYYHTHDGKPAIHKRIYVTTSKEENILSQYLIKDQESSDAWPYFDRVDSISMATLDTLSIGHNYPCKILQLQWKEEIIWRRN